MGIPDYQSLMLPVLKFVQQAGGEATLKQTVTHIGELFSLSEEEMAQLIPSGQSTLIRNRTHWAMWYLKKTGLFDSPKRGTYRLTQRGRDVLKQNPLKIDNTFLMQFPEFIEMRQSGKIEKGKSNNETGESTPVIEKTPEEQLETAYKQIRAELASEILDTIKQCTPVFFERLVVELLVTMGYGGSLEDAGQAIGRTGDGGIDGIIKEDKLGLDVIFVQAKRWTEHTVGRPDVQQFAGALQGQRAGKGIFLTTSRFSKEAQEYVKAIGSKIVLIDGETLANLMIDYNVGVATVTTFQIKRIDSDYFSEDI
jgi:restriction system protein